MKNALVLFTALSVGGALIGCSSKNHSSNPTPPVVNPQPPTPSTDPQAAAWNLKLQSKCQAVTDDQCLAAYGYVVYSDGKFQMGPSPAGAVKTGNLSPEELSRLLSALDPVLKAPAAATDSHEPITATDTPSEDTVTLARGSDEGEVMVRVSATDLTFRTSSGDLAKTLLSVMKNLATKYYSLPFPDTCTDGVTSLQTLFSSLQTCSVDADCSYLDSNYNVVDPNTRSFLATDDCTLVKPLTVANMKLLGASNDKLVTALSQVQESCGQRMVRSDCTEITGFNISGAAVCKQGVCQTIPASAGSH